MCEERSIGSWKAIQNQMEVRALESQLNAAVAAKEYENAKVLCDLLLQRQARQGVASLNRPPEENEAQGTMMSLEAAGSPQMNLSPVSGGEQCQPASATDSPGQAEEGEPTLVGIPPLERCDSDSATFGELPELDITNLRLSDTLPTFDGQCFEDKLLINRELVGQHMGLDIDIDLDIEPEPSAGEPTTSIFAYGTLRADYSERGDKWGVVDRSCSWRRATLKGYRLFEEEGVGGYPFCVKTGCETDQVVGTVLTWRGTVGADKLRRCDEIEGYKVEGGGFYERSTANVIDHAGRTTNAYVYHQQPKPPGTKVKEFPSGDWLARRSDSTKTAAYTDKDVFVQGDEEAEPAGTMIPSQEPPASRRAVCSRSKARIQADEGVADSVASTIPVSARNPPSAGGPSGAPAGTAPVPAKRPPTRITEAGPEILPGLRTKPATPGTPAVPGYNRFALTWNENRTRNAERQYSYFGRSRPTHERGVGKFGDAALHCHACSQWFFITELAEGLLTEGFLPQQRNYRFICAWCKTPESPCGKESFTLTEAHKFNAIIDVFLSLMAQRHNMSEHRTPELTKGRQEQKQQQQQFRVRDVQAFLLRHWNTLLFGEKWKEKKERVFELSGALTEDGSPAKFRGIGPEITKHSKKHVQEKGKRQSEIQFEQRVKGFWMLTDLRPRQPCDDWMLDASAGDTYAGGTPPASPGSPPVPVGVTTPQEGDGASGRSSLLGKRDISQRQNPGGSFGASGGGGRGLSRGARKRRGTSTDSVLSSSSDSSLPSPPTPIGQSDSVAVQ